MGHSADSIQLERRNFIFFSKLTLNQGQSKVGERKQLGNPHSNCDSIKITRELYLDKHLGINGTPYKGHSILGNSPFSLMAKGEKESKAVVIDLSSAQTRGINGKGVTLKSAQTIQGIQFPKGSIVTLNEGSLVAAYLSDHTVIQGIRLPPDTRVSFLKGNLGSAIFQGVITVDDLPISPISPPNKYAGGVFFFPNGKLNLGELAEDRPIQGIQFLRGTVIGFDENGHLIRVIPITDMTFQGIPVSKETEVDLWSNGRVLRAKLADDLNIQGDRFPKNSDVSFYSNGQPKEVKVSAITVIRGIKVWWASFEENGRLSSAVISNDQTIQGIPLPKKSRIFFDDNGKLIEAKIEEKATIHGIQFLKESYLEFYSNGKLKAATLGGDFFVPNDARGEDGNVAENTTIQGIKFPAGSEVEFYPDGKLKEVAREYEMSIKGLLVNSIAFYPNGKIERAELYSFQMIQGIPASGGSEVVFHPNGKIKKITLGMDHTIEEKPYQGGTILEFDQNGRVVTHAVE